MFSVDTIETSSLGDRSYVASDGSVAVVFDPQRDIDRVLERIVARGVRVTHVFETHVHNDYVTGGPDLARVTGSVYVVPARSGVTVPNESAHDGTVFESGEMTVRAVHTPGHTHHHTSYTVQVDGHVVAVFTGGSMLYGATGRTDLVAPADTETLTRAQFRSVRRLAAELPASTDVFPTHGFGSFCSATPTSGTSSTVGEQTTANPALTLDENTYVETLLAGLDAYPAYYAHMAPINRAGPGPLDLSDPMPVDGDELRERIQRGEWVVDLRACTAFAAGHVAGTRAFELGPNFVTYLGWLYDWGAPLTLVGDTRGQIAEARRELVRIGIDRVAGAAVGDIAQFAAGQPLRSYRVSDFAGLAARLARGPVQVLDARRDDERRQGHVPRSQHIPVHELGARVGEVPDGELWVYCGSGYRASIAASLLDRPGRDLVLVNDSYDNAAAAGVDAPPATH